MTSGSPSRLILAVDTGGTKCDALLARDDGTALGFGRCDFRCPASANHAAGRGRSRESVRAAVREALADAHACAELIETSGVPVPRRLYMRLGRPRIVRAGWSEWRAALSQAGVSHGIVALAGTGAMVFGITPDGRSAQCDGLGPLLGDYGSGFQIGQLAARAAARASWGARHATTLAEAVPQALIEQTGQAAPFNLVAFMMHNPDRSEVASLAAVVDREARAGDRISIAILHEAADALAESVRDVVETLGAARTDLPMVGTGSVATRCDIFWQHYCERVASFAPSLRPIRLDRPAVIGVALCALMEVEGANLEQCRYNLLCTFDNLRTEGQQHLRETR